MKQISSKLRYKCPVFSVTEDEVIEPGGLRTRRSIVRHAGSAVMMALDEKGRVLLVRQFRLAARASLWELPAGRIDPGETVLAAAKRELLEETGYRARHWRKLLSFYASPGYVAEKMTIFLATSLTAGKPKPMEDERIECRWFAPAEMGKLIRAGRILDGKTLLGYLAWQAGFVDRLP
jgi:ADP-ribose pyrophosphatase